jgi:hypothetical protein
MFNAGVATFFVPHFVPPFVFHFVFHLSGKSVLTSMVAGGGAKVAGGGLGSAECGMWTEEGLVLHLRSLTPEDARVRLGLRVDRPSSGRVYTFTNRDFAGVF